MENTILLVDASHGEYIPLTFAKKVLSGNIKLADNTFKNVVINICNEIDIDTDVYWDLFNDLMNICTIVHNGTEYYLTYEFKCLYAVKKNCDLTWYELFYKP